MSDETRSKGLGRGLSALIGDDTEEYGSLSSGRSPGEMPIEYLKPNPNQPRRLFDEAELADLASSIREKGILQPILIRQMSDREDDYQIVAGERRWRAAQKAGLHNVPVIIKDLSDAETLEIALIENIQRTDLNPIDEAAGYQSLIDEFSHTQGALAGLIGKSRSHIANSLRLLTLPADVLALISQGKLSAGHGRTLINADDPSSLAVVIIAKDMSVREAETLARGGRPTKPQRKKQALEKDVDTLALEDNLSSSLGLKVVIDHKGESGGALRINYSTLEQLDALCQRLWSR